MAQAWRPCARGLPLPTLAAAMVLATVPTFVVLLRGGDDVAAALVAASLVLGAVTAFAVEDPAEETLAASPTPLAHRRLLRLSAIALGVAATAGVLAVVVTATVAGQPTAGGTGRRAAELAATAGLASLAAGIARQRSAPGAAHSGAVAGVLGMLLTSSLAYRFHALPSLLDGPHHVAWWWLGAASSTVVAWTWRDPGRRDL